MMRTILTGRPKARHLDMYRRCIEAHHASAEALRPGNAVGEVFDAYARVLDRAGYRDARFSATGYSMGTTYPPSWMDWPMFYHGNPAIIEPGMVFFIHSVLMDEERGPLDGAGTVLRRHPDGSGIRCRRCRWTLWSTEAVGRTPRRGGEGAEGRRRDDSPGTAGLEPKELESCKAKRDVQKFIDDMKLGRLSRRDFNRGLASVGLGLVAAPLASRPALAAAEDHPTVYTWGGYEVPEMHGAYIEKHGASPNFSLWGDEEEAEAKMRAGFHP